MVLILGEPVLILSEPSLILGEPALILIEPALILVWSVCLTDILPQLLSNFTLTFLNFSRIRANGSRTKALKPLALILEN